MSASRVRRLLAEAEALRDGLAAEVAEHEVAEAGGLEAAAGGNLGAARAHVTGRLPFERGVVEGDQAAAGGAVQAHTVQAAWDSLAAGGEQVSSNAEASVAPEWRGHVAELVAVDEAWYWLTKGELQVDPRYEAEGNFDADLATCALAMWAEALNYSRTVDTETTDGPPPMGNTPGERVYLARRVAEALTVLHFGGPRGYRPTTEGGAA